MATIQDTAPGAIERRTIDVVPDSERHGTTRNQFTLWLGANLQITAIVDGALAVIFGADALWAIIGLLIGNILGGIVMALHSAQGPRLGLPQMISSRAQFGVYGAAIPLVLVVLMYLGFAATGTVLSGQAINKALGIDPPVVGIVIFGALTATVAILGYRYIHQLGRIASVVGILTFGFLAVRMFTQFDMGAIFADNAFHLPAFLLAVSLSAGWQLTYGPYVADYSRYLPRSVPEGETFRWTLGGTVLGSQLSMTFGAMLASLPLAKGDGFMANQVGFLGVLAGGGFVALVVYLVIVLGKLTVNTLNAYGGCMTILTTISAFTRRSKFTQAVRITIIVVFITLSVLIALLATKDFLNNFKNFVLTLLMVFTPWSAINLVDYYLISKERVDIPALYDPSGRYGRWNTTALVTYAVGILAQIPFLAQSLYTGPVTEALGGADISWIVGLVVPGLLYYVWAKRTSNVPEQMIYPPEIDG